MLEEDIQQIQNMVNAYGARDALKLFIQALRLSADQMSDLGLKERALAQAELSDVLQKVDETLGE
jgi:hypothetical protein